MSRKRAATVHVWAVLDSEYLPRMVAVDASANSDVAKSMAKERNQGRSRPRYFVVRCDGDAEVET